jgi:hypothetical protein
MTKDEKDMFKIYAYKGQQKMWFYLEDVINMVNRDEVDSETFFFTTMRDRNQHYEESHK